MEVLAEELGGMSTRTSQMASGVIFFKSEVHETIALWSAFYK
jgi:hypothetical protein